MVELVTLKMHNAAIVVNLVVAIDVEHDCEALHSRPQVYRFLLTSRELQPDKVALNEGPVMIQCIVGLLPGERPGMHPDLEELLSEVGEQHIAKVLNLLIDVALPLEALFVILRKNVQLNEVLVTCKKAYSFKQLCPANLLLRIQGLSFVDVDVVIQAFTVRVTRRFTVLKLLRGVQSSIVGIRLALLDQDTWFLPTTCIPIPLRRLRYYHITIPIIIIILITLRFFLRSFYYLE